jgi:AcrR family transcriptional regulator
LYSHENNLLPIGQLLEFTRAPPSFAFTGEAAQLVPLGTDESERSVVLCGTKVNRRVMAKAPAARRRRLQGDKEAVRERVLEAAFAAFVKNGYAATSTLDIATRARVSKRELYALVGNKEQMLVACITRRATRLRVPSELPVPQDRETLARVLESFGTQLLREVSDPAVTAVFRLAIGEATHAPEVAQALNSVGRGAVRTALREIMTRAHAAKLLEGSAAELSEQFLALLWGNLRLDLLLGLADQPSAPDLAERARKATGAFIQLHSLP